jgi:hypothetical protein
MRQLFAIALALVVVAAPACAQRGGGHGGGFGGGFSGHAAGGAWGGSSHYGGGAYGGGARVQGYGRVGGSGAAGARYLSPGVSSARPFFYNSRGRGDFRRRRDFAYGYPGWVDDGYLGYPDDGYYADDDYGYDGYGDGDDSVNGPMDDAGGAAENYVEVPGAGYRQPAAEEAEQSEEAFAQNTSPALFDSDGVTLVFKDGRPMQTIHNYALTRTALYVTDAHIRVIPVADLDLAATERVNRDAGVDFQLPVAQ